MNELSQAEETAIVKNAMELTATIEIELEELERAKAEKFRALPNPPKKIVVPQPEKILPQYPPQPKTTLTFTNYIKNIIGKYKKYYLLIGIVAFIILILGSIKFGILFIVGIINLIGMLIVPVLIAAFVSYYSKRKLLNQQLVEEPEYLQAIENAKKEAEKQQKEEEEKVRKEQEKLDAEYEKQKEHYETVIVAEYNEALSRWSVIKEKKIHFLEEELKYNKEALSDLYDTSKLISARYRELWILQWLYEDMNTSDHDIRSATELLDRERQRITTEEVGKRTKNTINDMHKTLQVGLNGIYNAIEYGNELQQESIEQLAKARRDNKVGNLVGTVQRHNTNKMLKSMLPKK